MSLSTFTHLFHSPVFALQAWNHIPGSLNCLTSLHRLLYIYFLFFIPIYLISSAKLFLFLREITKLIDKAVAENETIQHTGMDLKYTEQ